MIDRSPMKCFERRTGSLFLGLLIFLGTAAGPRGAENGARITWMEAPGGQVKIGGKIPITWGLYQPDKKDKKKDKDDMALVLLGRRYLLFDVKARAAYEVELADLKIEGKNVSSGEDLEATSHVIPTTDWSVRDVGPAEKINVTLGDYGSDLELQVPHPLILTPPLHYVY
jgi:hypothetical protein